MCRNNGCLSQWDLMNEEIYIWKFSLLQQYTRFYHWQKLQDTKNYIYMINLYEFHLIPNFNKNIYNNLFTSIILLWIIL